jgi:hypothetical protein
MVRSTGRRLGVPSSGSTRYAVPALLVALVVAGLALGRTGSHPSGPPALAPAQSLAQSVALTSSWFCAGATAGPGGAAPGSLVLDNSASRPVQATVQLVTEGGPAGSTQLTLPAASTRLLTEHLAAAPWTGAIVTFYGGMAFAEQEANTAMGVAVEPCATHASPHWYFPDGATLRNADEYVSLLNPYPLDVVADLSFTTDQGQEQPADFEGVVVPAHGLAVLDLRSHLRRRQRIALSVQTRGGQIVAFETELISPVTRGAPIIGTPGAPDPMLPVAGAELVLGAPATSESWWWPGGGDGAGVRESYVVYDPGPKPAQFRLSLVPESDGTSAVSVGSAQFTVAPQSTIRVSTNGKPWATPGLPYAVHLQSLSGVPVVAERELSAGAPSTQKGRAVLLGEQSAAGTWLLAPGPREPAGKAAMATRARSGTTASGRRAGQARNRLHKNPAQRTPANKIKALRLPPETRLVVLNPGGRPATVSVGGPAAGNAAKAAPLMMLTVAPGQSSNLQLPAGLVGTPLRVSSSQPVMVEEDSYAGAGALGANLAPGVPVSPVSAP